MCERLANPALVRVAGVRDLLEQLSARTHANLRRGARDQDADGGLSESELVCDCLVLAAQEREENDLALAIAQKLETQGLWAIFDGQDDSLPIALEVLRQRPTFAYETLPLLNGGSRALSRVPARCAAARCRARVRILSRSVDELSSSTARIGQPGNAVH
jgi:hypothetical protein